MGIELNLIIYGRNKWECFIAKFRVIKITIHSYFWASNFQGGIYKKTIKIRIRYKD